jgi:hypothetical protein
MFQPVKEMTERADRREAQAPGNRGDFFTVVTQPVTRRHVYVLHRPLVSRQSAHRLNRRAKQGRLYAHPFGQYVPLNAATAIDKRCEKVKKIIPRQADGRYFGMRPPFLTVFTNGAPLFHRHIDIGRQYESILFHKKKFKKINNGCKYNHFMQEKQTSPRIFDAVSVRIKSSHSIFDAVLTGVKSSYNIFDAILTGVKSSYSIFDAVLTGVKLSHEVSLENKKQGIFRKEIIKLLNYILCQKDSISIRQT